jgi:hypothetical protein
VTKNVIKINDYLGMAVKNKSNGTDVEIIRFNNPTLKLRLRNEKNKKRFRT